jgi:Zn-dependent protease with chaperone function
MSSFLSSFMDKNPEYDNRLRADVHLNDYVVPDVEMQKEPQRYTTAEKLREHKKMMLELLEDPLVHEYAKDPNFVVHCTHGAQFANRAVAFPNYFGICAKEDNMVVIPEHMLSWEPEVLKPIIAHELAHLICRDTASSVQRANPMYKYNQKVERRADEIAGWLCGDGGESMAKSLAFMRDDIGHTLGKVQGETKIDQWIDWAHTRYRRDGASFSHPSFDARIKYMEKSAKQFDDAGIQALDFRTEEAIRRQNDVYRRNEGRH